MHWEPTWGAWPTAEGTRFRVWAPEARTVAVVLSGGEKEWRLRKDESGVFQGVWPGVGAGAYYRYRVDGRGPFPDPASRFQPEGVHGPSEVIDPRRFAWSDQNWKGVGLEELVVYELHVGTFTPAGSYAGVCDQLPYLADLGVTAIELMPLADFPGRRNWGYDGVALFAPARCYGRPEELRRLVDAAHRQGLAVLLDVVYNHLGPDGNYLACFSPYYFSAAPTAWGAGLNFDGAHADMVRRFFLENALHWIHEYHIDGLRLDATHVIRDRGPRHFLAELSEEVHAAAGERRMLLIAEDHRNQKCLVETRARGGWGLDAVWADDFHHQLRRFLAGDHEGCYRDYRGTLADLAETMRRGWFFQGRYSRHYQEKRGTDAADIPPRRFVYCLQNHDQIGNRALGERLHHQIELADYRAATTLLLCSPGTPLLFMGQEWAASSPFLYFTDHEKELGARVAAGRRREFRHFAAFADPAARGRIPDPQACGTCEASRLLWEERNREPHASTARLYRELLRLRRREAALRSQVRSENAVAAVGGASLVLRRAIGGAPALLIVTHWKGAGVVDLRGHPLALRHGEVVLTTEEPRFCPAPLPIDVADGPCIHFPRAGAVILRET